jgi:cell wall-associated NlpC family hydrolase
MTNPAAIDAMLAAARSALATPFHHQGRLVGAGLDCIGLVVISLRAGGIMVRDRLDYERAPRVGLLSSVLLAHGAQKVAAMQAGDVLLFAIRGLPQHVALCVSDDVMIHAYAPAAQVVETRLGEVWQRRLLGIYRFP